MKLHFKQTGQGSPVIIAHGLLGMSDNWYSFAKKLSENHMVYTVDLRNHGRSPHADEMNYEVMATDLLQFMEDQWLFDDVTLIGHSMGGKAAMQLALTEPDMVKKLIIVDIGPGAYSDRHSHILEALDSVSLSGMKSRKEVEEQLQGSLSDRGVVAFLMKNLKRTTEGFRWRANLPVLKDAYPQLMGGLSTNGTFEGHTLFVRGSTSDYIREEETTLIQQLFPQASILTIDNAGHWVHADQPDKLLRVVHDFLDN